MRARQDHHAGAGQRGRTSARWRAAAIVVAAAVLTLTAGAVPASAAGGYTVTATIPVGPQLEAVAADPAAGTVYVANMSADTVSVISAVRVPTALTASIGLSWTRAITLTATLTAADRSLRGQPVSFSTGHTRLCTRDTSTRGVATCVLSAPQARQVGRDLDTIRASYPGNATYQPSSATAMVPGP